MVSYDGRVRSREGCRRRGCSVAGGGRLGGYFRFRIGREEDDVVEEEREAEIPNGGESTRACVDLVLLSCEAWRRGSASDRFTPHLLDQMQAR